MAVSVSLQCPRGLRMGWSPVPQGQSLILHPCAPICSIQMFPFGSTRAQSRALNPGTGRHLLQNLLFGLGAGKALGSLRALPQAVSVGASLSPHSGPTAHRVSPCQWHCQDPLPWQGAPLVWAQVPGGCQGAQEGAGTVTAPQGPQVLWQSFPHVSCRPRSWGQTQSWEKIQTWGSDLIQGSDPTWGMLLPSRKWQARGSPSLGRHWASAAGATLLHWPGISEQ